MELIINIINGRFNNYSKVWVSNGYCFYDVDDEQRQYMNSITTPLTDETEIKRKYVVVMGDAEKLNQALEEERGAEDDR